jgi:hemin uptake protein HemP
MKKNKEENEKTFSDYQTKSWFQDENKNIKAGDNISKIMSGDCETIEVKELLQGEPYKTWKIVIDNNDKIYLLKTSRELK